MVAKANTLLNFERDIAQLRSIAVAPTMHTVTRANFERDVAQLRIRSAPTTHAYLFVGGDHGLPAPGTRRSSQRYA